MSVRIQSGLFFAAAAASFSEVAFAPKNSEPGPWAAAILGVLLLRRAIIAAPQPLVAVLSGYVLTAVLLGGDHGLLNVNNPAWVGVVVAAGIAFALCEKIGRMWRRRRGPQKAGG